MSTAPAPLRIDFVSDVVCPWCAIGLTSLEQALQRLAGEVEVDVHFHPFELNPQLPAEGEGIAEHLQRKYGLSPAQLEENQQRIHERGAELGFPFDMNARSRIYNTFDAHRLLHWAEQEGKQAALKHALFRAYFTDNQSMSDHEVLVRVVASVGLDADRARTILAGDEYAAEVRAQQKYYHDQGIHAVPAIVINERYLISGGQPVELFERALREIAAAPMATPEAEV